MMLKRYLLVMALLLAACQRAESRAEPKQEEPATADGLCKEHGVLESVCTKCNPALVAVFRAQGDFCEEHGFPESFCPICHPERGGRPVANVQKDEAPPDGLKVHFKTKETARLAGIKVAEVMQRPGAAQLRVTAKLAYDATKVAEVNARSPGVVRSVSADIGTRVRAGAALATIESADVGSSKSRLDTARARVELAQANHTRIAKLHQDGIAAQKEVHAAQADLAAAKAELGAAQSAVTMVGGVTGASRYVLSAPIAGTVTQRNATIGHLVASTEVLFQIVDTSSLWAELDIPESALTRVLVGQKVVIATDGLSDREFGGTLSYVAPQIDPRTRTALGRVALENPDGLLRANMFASARVSVGSSQAALIVPRAALQRVRDAHLVFVRVASDTFETRRVEIGDADEDSIEVRGRLKPGDEVATEGSFLLKTETLKGSIGAGCCEAEKP